MVTIITGTTKKPISSERLKEFFSDQSELEGTLYIGYPIIGTVNGAYPIDALWVSKERGLIVFNLIEGKNSDGYEDEQDNSFNKLESKLKGYRELVEKRVLQVLINVVTFAPAIAEPKACDEYPIFNKSGLLRYLQRITWDKPELYERLLSVIQSVSLIRKGSKRNIIKPTSRGAKVLKLEESIANLDSSQSRAVIETVEGVQRIRGLAGSGKTIVLALKAAYLHAQHPDWKIAVTFNTRSLKGTLRKFINSFYIEQTNSEPDWDKVQVIHAWGANSQNKGIYYNFCLDNGVEWSDYATAKKKYGRHEAFSGVCTKALDDALDIEKAYDAILVDEAQDFPISFFRMCYELLKEPKRLVYAYDELQNLDLEPLPSPEELFGVDENNRSRVKFAVDSDGKTNQDIILEKCYRNSRPTLVTAHALGFGIYRKIDESIGTGLVQMFERKSLWTDIGYRVIEGDLDEGKKVVLARDDKSSPKFLENHSEIDDLIMFKAFDSTQKQDEWVANEIIKNIQNDELKPNDIIVINPNPLTTTRAVAGIRKILFNNGIQSHVAGVDSSPDVFFETGNESVTFTGIYRAKGNEAAMVYVINSDDCAFEYDYLSGTSAAIAKQRNRLFTAITRSKAWVRVVGVGPVMDVLLAEYEKIKANNFVLDFVYPTEKQRKYLNIVNRDMSASEKHNIEEKRKAVDEFLYDIESGNLFLQDLGAEQVERLKKALNNNK